MFLPQRRISLGGALCIALAAAITVGCQENPPTGVPAGEDFFGTTSLSTNLVCETIDFDGFVHGDVVTSVSALGVTFAVTVLDPGSTSTGDAVIYDTNTSGGADPDLEASGTCAACAGLNNVLILQEVTRTGDPDDSDSGGTIRFAPTSGGPFVIQEFKGLDQETEQGETITLEADGAAVAMTSGLGDGSVETVDVNPDATFSAMLDFIFSGSGAIDDLVVCEEQNGGGGEGCTPGYWKNHLEDWAATGFAPGDDFDATFGVDLFNPNITLEQAVNLGGGGVNRLARHGTAALLSAAHGDVDYPYSVAEVIAFVQAGDADALEAANELGCDIP